MHFLSVFILQFLYNSTCFERPFRSSSGVHDLLYLQLCTNHAKVPNCSALRLVPNRKAEQLVTMHGTYNVKSFIFVTQTQSS